MWQMLVIALLCSRAGFCDEDGLHNETEKAQKTTKILVVLCLTVFVSRNEMLMNSIYL
jgi:hypothetical protein